MLKHLAVVAVAALIAACGKGPIQTASVPDKVTTLQTPHTAEECEAAAKQVAPKGKCKGGIWFSSHLSEIAKRQKEVESFTPGRGWLVGSSNYNHLTNAISASARTEWLTGAKALDYAECPALTTALCKLAHAAESKLPQYLPDPKGYPAHDSDEEKLMLGAIEDLPSHTIFYVGLEQAGWMIDKNGLGIPTARYKHGMAWVRFAPDDHPYCRAYYINVVQEYSGAGTYADSEARFIEQTIVGCPPKS